jgi:Mor family transcriptional regulator
MLSKYHKQQLEKRDKKILKDKLSGKYSNMELANKYHLTYARVLQIISNLQVKQQK